MEHGLYEIAKLGEWTKTAATADWSVEIEVKRNHERLTTGLLLVDGTDAQQIFRDWVIGADEYVARKAFEYRIGQWLLRMLMSGIIPEGTLHVGSDIVDRAMDLFADPDRYEEFEVRPDGPELGFYGF